MTARTHKAVLKLSTCIVWPLKNCYIFTIQLSWRYKNKGQGMTFNISSNSKPALCGHLKTCYTKCSTAMVIRIMYHCI